jgi:general stress protein YciG
MIPLDNLPGKYIYNLTGQVMSTDKQDTIREYLKKIARKGGKARAAKYDKATLSKWAKKGGRPPKKGETK